MMNLTNRDLLEAFNSGSVDKIHSLKVSELGAAQAQRLQKTLRAMRRHIQDYNKVRQDLIKELGVEREDGEYILEGASKENKEKFMTEVDELLSAEVEIPVTPLKITDTMTEKIDMGVLVNLWFLFDDSLIDEPGDNHKVQEKQAEAPIPE